VRKIRQKSGSRNTREPERHDIQALALDRLGHHLGEVAAGQAATLMHIKDRGRETIETGSP